MGESTYSRCLLRGGVHLGDVATMGGVQLREVLT